MLNDHKKDQLQSSCKHLVDFNFTEVTLQYQSTSVLLARLRFDGVLEKYQSLNGLADHFGGI